MTQSTNINPLTGEPIGTYSKSEPFADFSDWKGEPILSEDPAIKQAAMDAASEDAAIAKALQEAKAAMNEAKEKQFNHIYSLDSRIIFTMNINLLLLLLRKI